jgi:hypothetical protein
MKPKYQRQDCTISIAGATTMEATLAPPYTLKIRLGNAEFDGCGPEESIRADYILFLEAHKICFSGNGSVASQGTAPAAASGTQQSAPTDDSWTDPLEAAWDRAYLRKDGKLSLHVLPTGKSANSDALLLLIYGFQSLLGLDAVPSVGLMDAAQQSGLRIDRVERNLTPDHRKLIIKGGNGKGTRYSLNNRGLKVAQELLERLFD